LIAEKVETGAQFEAMRDVGVLEFQGYCPWTLVEARGLLLPGKPGKRI
jgi:hypothetical protein